MPVVLEAAPPENDHRFPLDLRHECSDSLKHELSPKTNDKQLTILENNESQKNLI